MRAPSIWSISILLCNVFVEGQFGPIEQTANEALSRRQATKTSACCAALANALPGKVLSPSDRRRFNDQRQSYWNNQNREHKPACFVLPSTPQEVSLALTTLTNSNSTNSNCQFSIRSGGHSPIPGWSTSDGGVTFDMSTFTGVNVASDKSYVDIRPGTRWSEVYSVLQKLDIGTSGGRVATVGVGGLVTGGGISYFSREKGFVCDNVIEFEVALADGRIIIANESQNNDLYRALKGGSGNFGIVVRFRMRTFNFPGGRMWGGTLVHRGDDRARQRLFANFYEYAKSSADPNAHWIHSWSFVNAVVTKIWAVTSNVQYTKPVENPEIFRRVMGPDMTLLPMTGMLTLTEQADKLADLNKEGERQLFATLTFKNSVEFMEEFYQIADRTVQPVRNALGLRWTISFQSIPHSAYSRAAETGGNSLGLDDDTDDLVVALLTATWNLGVDDVEINKAARRLFVQGKRKAVEMGVDSSFVYLNYAQKWQDPIGGYGDGAVARLRETAAKYDPNGVFRSHVPGGFKIPDVDSEQWAARTWVEG